jgi:minor extracellular protease Epr
MKKVILFSILTVVLLSSMVLAITDMKISDIKHNRVIARTNSPIDRTLFRLQGCKITHELKDATSLDCPEDVKIPNSEPDVVLHIMDLQADQQIGADKVWSSYDGSGVTVAVLDTGVDSNHQELSDSIAGGKSFVSYTTSYYDDHGHGTHVSGIITANGVGGNLWNGQYLSKGVAPGASVWMAKVCDASGSCYTSDIAAAIDYVVNGPDGTPNTGDEPAKIMSISLGGGGTRAANCDSDYLASRVNWAVSNGVTVVVAAGNTGGIVSSPGCASGAISVGAVDKNDVRPSWSGSGSALKIVAPGVSIYSSLPGNTYASWSGTSMATPHVSATIALIKQKDPSLTDSDIKNILYTTAKDLGSAGWDKYYGWGRVDAYNAYLAIKPVPKCSSDAECDDGLYCNGVEKCVNSVCQAGISVDCSSLSNECNNGVCDENLKACIAQPKPNGTSCDDGLFCTNPDTCTAGVCGGPARSCDDGKACTTDSCNENTDKCDNIWSACGIADGCCGPTCNNLNDPDCAATKCWSASYQYLYMNSNQAKKFCKCAQGTYGYKSYKYNFARKTVYYYLDSNDNNNWDVSSRSSYNPIYQVTCTDGKIYQTNKDYYR